MLFKDQLNRTIELVSIPQRIVSLVPSQTELLFDLGLNETVVGITKFCVHPKEWHQSKTRIGGTKNVNVEKIISLNPDLIIANKEENLKEDIEALEKITPIWISDINNLDTALQMIISIGEITNAKRKALQISNNIEGAFNKLIQTTNHFKTKTCVYLIWQNPYMTIGSDTFINEMLKYCKLENVIANKTRYPEIVLEDIQNLRPEIVLLSSEPYPFKQKHIDELQEQLPNTKILLVDGEMFSWYGSRLLLAANYFENKFVLVK